MRIVFLILQAFFCQTFALHTKFLSPTVQWISESISRENSGDDRLRINFADGNYDVINFSGNQRIANSEGSPICIMTGQFENEEDVHVTLSGRCGDTKNFQMTIVGSQKLGHTMLKVTNGSAEYIESSMGVDLVEAIRSLSIEERSSDGPKLPRQGLQIDLTFYWHDKFRDYWRSYNMDFTGAMQTILAHAQTYYMATPSKAYYLRLNFDVGSIFTEPANRNLELSDLNSLSEKQKQHKGLIDIYFGISTTISTSVDTYGKAFTKKVCVDRKQSAAVVLHKATESGTGQTLATMISELLGMREWWSRTSFRVKYEAGWFKCLKTYQCHDESWCSTFKPSDCSTLLKAHDCPKMCGVCSLTPYPVSGLQLNLHIHHTDEFEKIWKGHYSKDVTTALKDIMDTTQTYFQSGNVILRLNIKKVSKFSNPGGTVLKADDKGLTGLKSLVNPNDGCHADIFLAMFDPDDFGGAGRGVSNQICRDRTHSLAMILQDRWLMQNQLALNIADMLSMLLGVRTDEDPNVDDVKKSYENGRLQCLQELPEK